MAQHSSRPELLEAEPGGLLTSRGTGQSPALLLTVSPHPCAYIQYLWVLEAERAPSSSTEPGLQNPWHL